MSSSGDALEQALPVMRQRAIEKCGHRGENCTSEEQYRALIEASRTTRFTS